MTAEWKALTDKQKKKWDDAAAKDKERYEEEKSAYGGEKNPNKDAEKKGATSGYMVFATEFREKNKITKGSEQMKQIGEAWKKLSEKDKDKYNKKAVKK